LKEKLRKFEKCTRNSRNHDESKINGEINNFSGKDMKLTPTLCATDRKFLINKVYHGNHYLMQLIIVI
jgi:hypothetical protein